MNRCTYLLAVLVLGLTSPLFAQYVATYDCGFDGWEPENPAFTVLKHGRTAAPDNSARMELRPAIGSNAVQIKQSSLTIDGTMFHEFAIDVEAPFLAPGEELPITAIAYRTNGELAYFDTGVTPVVGPDRQTVRYSFTTNFRRTDIGRLDIKFGGDSRPISRGGVVALDWLTIDDDPAFVPAVQDTSDCGAATHFTFDCDLNGWVGNPNLLAGWANRDGGKVLVTFPSDNPNNAQFNPPNAPFSVNVDETPWLIVNQKVTGTQFPAGDVFILINSSNQNPSPGLPGYSEVDPIIQMNLADYFSGVVDISEIRFVQAAPPEFAGTSAELEIDWIAFAEQPGFFPPEQDTETCTGSSGYAETFDCDVAGWTNANASGNVEHGFSPAPENGGRLVVTSNGRTSDVQIQISELQIDGTANFQFAMSIEAPFLAPGEQLPITAVARLADDTLVYFDPSVTPVVGPDPQIVRYTLTSGFRRPEIAWIQLRFGSDAAPIAANEFFLIDWLAINTDPLFVPSVQDSVTCPEPELLDWPLQAVQVPDGVDSPIVDGVINPGEWAPTGTPVPNLISTDTIQSMDVNFPEFRHPGTVIDSVSDPADLSATVYAVWDDEALYFAAEIIDDVLLPSVVPATNDGDAFQVSIDYDENQPPLAFLEFSAVYIPTYAAAPNTNDPTRFQNFFPTDNPNPMTGTTWAVTETAGGWSVETRIPWTAFTAGGDTFSKPFPPVVGQTAGAIVVLPDSDTTAGVVDGFLVTNGDGADAIVDATTYNTLVFVETPTVSATVSEWHLWN